LIRPQRLASPTFQTPLCNTAVPLWLFSRFDPPDVRSYVTVAMVADVSVTLVTLAPRLLTRLARPLMAPANVLPFCSRVTRSELGVLELKNFSQFAVICATAAELPEADDEAGAEDAGAEEAGAEEAGAEEAGAEDEAADEDDDEVELLQAATASASARPSTGARMIRRATSGNRIARP
jgi:hypothetical protein